VRQWLNLFTDQEGHWAHGAPKYAQASVAAEIGGRTVRIHEVARSGQLILAPAGAALTSFGDPEVFLTITHVGGTSEYRSAPTSTDSDVENVQTLLLTVLAAIANDACANVEWHMLVNAHCVYEVV
jgi:hypothetical protein